MEIGSGIGVGAVLRRGTGDEDAAIAVVEIVMFDEDVGIIRVGDEKSICPVGKKRSVAGVETVPAVLGQRPVEICVSVDLLSGEKKSGAGAETTPVVLGQGPMDN
jgi:hypothetical protein